VVHLSDLHFGRARPELLDPLVAAVNSAAPDLVVISGDFTQRARVEQYREAHAFLERIAAPWLAVPGNHDVPLDNLPVRMLTPWRRYRRWIARNLEPQFSDEELCVVGLNTVNPLSWQRGKIAERALRRARSAFGSERGERTRIVVVHHPLEHQPDERKKLMRGATAAIDALADCGADIVLSGHLHAWRAEPFATRQGRHHGAIQVQAGTGLSTRLRGEENDFNLLSIGPGEVVVERFVADSASMAFVRAATARFQLGTGGWSVAAPPAGG
jgi:3',5'-cyclic AMP phosphodiesterase CpdA